MPTLLPNPWIALPSQPPFVLASDCLAVDVYNERAPDHLLIRTNLIPEPFFGPFLAPIVVLLLNPGVDEQDAVSHADPSLRKRLVENLCRDDPEQAHLHLTKGAESPGARWWRRAVRALEEHADLNHIAKNVLAIEYFPYHSKSFGHGTLRLPSQDFTFSLVRQAITRGAMIVLARGADHWLGAVPELAGCASVARLTNPRSISLSHRNLGPSYERLCQALNSARAA